MDDESQKLKSFQFISKNNILRNNEGREKNQAPAIK